ncbi:MAG TPA: putative glycoside hydrolase [Gammaproteobacteria bacterium]
MRALLSGFSTLLFGIALAMGGLAWAEQAEVNPDFAYFFNGDTPGGWHWVLADPGNWYMPLEGNEGVSAGGKLTMTAPDSPEIPGAIKLVWKGTREWASGAATIAGRTVDLSAYEHTAELALALKLDQRTRKPVYVKMACGDECAAEVPVHHHLKKMNKKGWFALPIPLDCFVAQGAKLKNITSPFGIITEGKMVLHIAEVSIRPMAEGDQGCLPNSETTPDDTAQSNKSRASENSRAEESKAGQ